MKRFVIIFTEKENEQVECHTINEGFSGMELIGLLEVKKCDVLKQFMYPERFKRNFVDDDGTMSELVEESEDTK